jgi:hypothetical protein
LKINIKSMKKLLFIISIIISQSQIINAQMFGGMMIIKKPNFIGTLGAINCAGATRSGNLVSNMLSNNVSIQIPYTGGNGGSYNGQIVNSTSITGLTATLTAGNFVNGSGTVTYSISGTPSGTGTANFAINIGGLTCTLSTSVSAPPSFNCAGTTISPNNWTLTNGSSYSGTISIPYTAVAATAGAAFPADTIQSNGLMFVRPAGTYASSGSIVYTISGSYTGVTNTIFTITTNAFAGSCNIVIFDAIRGAIALGGNTSGAAYDATSVNSVVSITKSEYDKIALIAGASKTGVTDAYIGSNSPNPQHFGGNVTFASAPVINSKIPADNYIMAFQVRTTSVSPANMAGIQLKTSTGNAGTYVDYGGTTPTTATSNASTSYCFVYKRPSAKTAAAASSFFAFYVPQGNQIQVYNSGGGTSYAGGGNLSTLPLGQPINFVVSAQFLATPTKQW